MTGDMHPAWCRCHQCNPIVPRQPWRAIAVDIALLRAIGAAAFALVRLFL